MKTVSITRVRNELDIVEPFVRHHALHVDKLIVLDNGSVDGTHELLRSLQAEGLPLVVIRAQAEIGRADIPPVMRLLRIAFDRFGADWVIPIGVDEFIETHHGARFAHVLAAHGQRLIKLGWSNYVWTASDDQRVETNPVLRLRLRTPRQTEPARVVVPAALAMVAGAALTPGSHGLTFEGKDIAPKLLHDVTLCRFPARTALQYASRMAAEYLERSAGAPHKGHEGCDCRALVRLVCGGTDQLVPGMPGPHGYGPLQPDFAPDRLEDSPLQYAGGPLRFAPKRDAVLAAMLLGAEAAANRLIECSREREDLVRALREATPGLLDAEPLQRVQQLRSLAAEQTAAFAEDLERCLSDRAALVRRIEQLDGDLLDMSERLAEQANELGSPAFGLARRLRRLYAVMRLPLRALGR